MRPGVQEPVVEQTAGGEVIPPVRVPTPPPAGGDRRGRDTRQAGESSSPGWNRIAGGRSCSAPRVDAPR
eukprot:7705350-Karenia_brevis.AAC.1